MWPFIFLAIMLLVSLIVAIVELAVDVWTGKTRPDEKKGAVRCVSVI